ncbi:MAG: replication-relaxation family protein [Bryobacteraceae bacterium]
MAGTDHRIILQDRDRQLLGELAIMRVIDREQAKSAAGFRSTTRANTRLLALTRAGLLRRFFLGTTGGARKSLYALSPKGAAFAAVPYRGPRRAQDQMLVADFFLSHQLLVNHLYCILKHRQIPIADAKLIRWRSFYEPLKGSALIPDGYAEITTADRNLAVFLEVDLGHESRSVWRKKVQAYLQYAVSGNFTASFGQPQFRTLVVANSERRVASLCAATASLTNKIFWFSTFEAIDRDGFWAPVWRRALDDSRQTLI